MLQLQGGGPRRPDADRAAKRRIEIVQRGFATTPSKRSLPDQLPRYLSVSSGRDLSVSSGRAYLPPDSFYPCVARLRLTQKGARSGPNSISR
jgi:hypothetical protein